MNTCIYIAPVKQKSSEAQRIVRPFSLTLNPSEGEKPIIV